MNKLVAEFPVHPKKRDLSPRSAFLGCCCCCCRCCCRRNAAAQQPKGGMSNYPTNRHSTSGAFSGRKNNVSSSSSSSFHAVGIRLLWRWSRRRRSGHKTLSFPFSAQTFFCWRNWPKTEEKEEEGKVSETAIKGWEEGWEENAGHSLALGRENRMGW